MHAALLSDDILHTIFRQFELDQWHRSTPLPAPGLPLDDPFQTENERLRCLARSARVCTAFRDAALPILWGTLYDLVPFLRLFPSCITTHNLTGRVGARGTHPGPYTYRLSTSYVSRSELQRILLYGAMVRAVGKHHGYQYQGPGFTLYNHRADPASWVYLQAVLDGNPRRYLLPNLRRLSVQVFNASDLDLVSAVASPSLSDLELINFDHPNNRPPGGWQHVLEERIPALLSAAPNLTQLHLSFHENSHISNRIASAIARVTSLRTLYLRFSHAGGMESESPLWMPISLLSPLENLERLVLGFGSDVPVNSSVTLPAQGLVATSLHNLREVEVLSVECVRNYHRLFKLLQSRTIQRLTLRTIVYVDAFSLRDLCRVLTHSFSKLSSFFCHFIIRSRPRNTAAAVTVEPLRTAISPLLSLQTLQDVSIHADLDISLHISLSDDDLEAMASSWPALRVFSLIGFDILYHVFYDEPRISELSPLFGISLSAIATLATNCPHLEQLEIPLLDVQPHRVRPKDSYPFLNHQLRRFEAHDMYVGDYSTAACIIDRIFPSVDIVAPLAAVSEQWTEICSMRWDHAPEMSWTEWRFAAQYGLYLGIIIGQDGRDNDPWLSWEL